MKKDDSIEFRIESAQKARWLATVEELEYDSLSALIIDTFEAVHFPEVAQAGPLLSLVPNVGVELESGATGTFDHPVELAPDPEAAMQCEVESQPKVAPPTLAKECPNQGKHRRGIFCKRCKRVI